MAKKITKKQVRKAVKIAKKHPKAAIISILIIAVFLGVTFFLYSCGKLDGILKPSSSPSTNTTEIVKTTTTQNNTTIGPTTTKKPKTTREFLTDYINLEVTDKQYINATLFSSGFTPIECEDGIIENVIYDDFQIHFMELGVYNAGDSTYIKCGDIDILIDAGAEKKSSTTIESYVDKYCSDGVLEYVIVTHGHKDHIAGFVGTSDSKVVARDGSKPGRNGIFYYYNIGTIIDFSQTNQSATTEKGGDSLYGEYLKARDYAVSKGTTRYSAYECFYEKNGAESIYYLSETENIYMTILYNKYYENTSSDENNYSVCTLFTYNESSFLLTGDLEKEGEESLSSYYNGSTKERTLPEVELFKAGHHGSATSSNETLLKKIKPKMSVVCCCAGSTEYTVDLNTIFPTQDFINRISKYTDRVYVTSIFNEQETMESNTYTFESMNGNVTVSSNGKYTGLYASNNLTKLKDTTWFNETVYIDKDGHIASGTKGSKVFYKKGDKDDKDGQTEVTATTRRIWPTSE